MTVPQLQAATNSGSAVKTTTTTTTTTFSPENSTRSNSVVHQCNTSSFRRIYAGALLCILITLSLRNVILLSNIVETDSVATSASAAFYQPPFIQPLATTNRKSKTTANINGTSIAAGGKKPLIIKDELTFHITAVPKKKPSTMSTPPPPQGHELTRPAARQTNTSLPPLFPPVYPTVDAKYLRTALRSKNQSSFLTEYEQSLLKYPRDSTVPWPNLTTLAFAEGRFRSGFRNQMMAFTIFVLEAIQSGHGQILLNSIDLKDTYGSDKAIKFQRLWDVAHWNSHHYDNSHSILPRLVTYDPIVHDQYNGVSWYQFQMDGGKRYYTNVEGNVQLDAPTRPFASPKQAHLMTAYIRYANKGQGPYVNKAYKQNNLNGGRDNAGTSAGGNSNSSHRHPAEILMLQGALRPHPDIQDLIDEKMRKVLLDAAGGSDFPSTNIPTNIDALAGRRRRDIEYMTLHARVEPDMQKHTVCLPKKVLNLTEIFTMLEDHWKDPPTPYMFLPVNRQLLEMEGSESLQQDKQKNQKVMNSMAVENLKALNRASTKGLWGGRVRVFEFGSGILKGTKWEDRPSTTGALLNFFIGIDAKIFVGTEVSSYSHDLLATRFYRGMMENYKYLPGGLYQWTPPDIADPPGFGC